MKAHLVYFSPNDTTKSTLKKISEGLSPMQVIIHDLSLLKNRQKKHFFTQNDLVILGLPSAGMLYGRVKEIFDSIEGDNTPMVGVIMYGNGYYGVALKEMNKRAKKKGFKMAAMGTFIGQHALCSEIASGRPDEKDKTIQLEFGKAIYSKVVINKNLKLTSKPKTGWANNLIYNTIVALRHVLPGEYKLTDGMKAKVIDDGICITCGKCAKNCPVDAINIETKTFDYGNCIGCNRCINNCPQQAISSTSKLMKAVMVDFKKQNQKRLEPDLFL